MLSRFFGWVNPGGAGKGWCLGAPTREAFGVGVKGLIEQGLPVFAHAVG